MPRRGRSQCVECGSIEPENELVGVGQNMITARLSRPEGRTSDFPRCAILRVIALGGKVGGGKEGLISLSWWHGGSEEATDLLSRRLHL